MLQLKVLTAVYVISGNMRIRRNSGLFIVESLAPDLFVVQIRMN